MPCTDDNERRHRLPGPRWWPWMRSGRPGPQARLAAPVTGVGSGLPTSRSAKSSRGADIPATNRLGCRPRDVEIVLAEEWATIRRDPVSTFALREILCCSSDPLDLVTGQVAVRSHDHDAD
jgi:hypothetical protein